MGEQKPIPQICTICGGIGTVGRCCGRDTHRDTTEAEVVAGTHIETLRRRKWWQRRDGRRQTMGEQMSKAEQA